MKKAPSGRSSRADVHDKADSNNPAHIPFIVFHCDISIAIIFAGLDLADGFKKGSENWIGRLLLNNFLKGCCYIFSSSILRKFLLMRRMLIVDVTLGRPLISMSR